MTWSSMTIASSCRGRRRSSRPSICLALRIPERVIARDPAVLNGDRPPSDAPFHYHPAMREWPTTTEVAPSILSADFARMRDHTGEVLEAGARVIHIDVMDGHFVPVITFGPKMVADLSDLIHEHGALADVHLMI